MVIDGIEISGEYSLDSECKEDACRFCFEWTCENGICVNEVGFTLG